ncbi:Uncharacterised protein [Zhongshania aliphaticivorans]|uniref:UPF0235 protein IHBHHGIJ_02938 n=1 Tax=Zhongshania aliphaticivorans TaxID=1470434 RepID=A0A5S9PNV8_9GAMM|nr:DUF167 family protein [Zhongshania aliphaticivorans]CAA0106120.1 Uncharacterised protein [Zhongshania aliphaticivorans]CAA0106328.1 Uncharacterised protein [Zhongshania aliphaticivorans]
MAETPTFYRWHNGNLTLFCHIQPGASSNEFSGQHGDRLKIRVRAAASDGKANAGLIAFIAKEFGLSKNAVELTAGAQSRQKTLKISAPLKIPKALAVIKSAM